MQEIPVNNIDMSVLGLISNADLTVKLVILLLIIASISSWTIIFEKLIKFKNLNNICNKFEKSFWAGQSFEQLYDRLKNRVTHPYANIFISSIDELNLSNRSLNTEAIKERINQNMNLVCNKEINQLEKYIYFLAICASNAPFIGLFGTVWGIMHSFQSIAASKNTTLAVVAPGIAEALLATAIGLIAAIPAAIFYNILTDKINKLANRFESFSNEIALVISRELDQKM